MEPVRHLNDIVQAGLCIGCGLCQSVAPAGHVEIVMTPEGRQRPITHIPLDDVMVKRVADVCPGTEIHGLPDELFEPETIVDDVWGAYISMQRGFATDPEIRHLGSTGGVLTALGIYLIESDRVDFVLHVAASKEEPMRTERQVSFDRAQVIEGAGSRYGPAAPLIDFMEILDREKPFAFIGKPCDVTALRNLAKYDERVDKYCLYKLTLVCGGASELGKSEDVLTELGLDEDELSLFRYRGFGNPGPTRIETKDGRVFEKTYQQMWEDEGKWRIQFRCKMCLDAIGEVSDIAASDVWPGGGPTGEDEGFNGIITRTKAGQELLEAAIADGVITVDQPLTPRDMDVFQPHQVRKKYAVWARIHGLRRANVLYPQRSKLRARRLGLRNTEEYNESQRVGAYERAKDGVEPPPSPRTDEPRRDVQACPERSRRGGPSHR